jgi:hypothetical protein
MFRQGGPGGSDLAIEHVSGAQPAVLAIRIIDPSRVDDND